MKSERCGTKLSVNTKLRMTVTGLSLAACAGLAQGQSFIEGFEGGALPPGWTVVNNSSPIGTESWEVNNTGSFPGGTAMINPPHGGQFAAYANFQSTAGTGTISNWLITPQASTIGNNDQFSFWTRTRNPSTYPDRLQVRLSAAGASANVGATATSVGDFTTLLLDINPTYLTTGYPTAYTQQTITVSGLGSPVNGRFAFRYFVENGGPTGSNSEIVGVDDVQYIPFGSTGACCFANGSCTPGMTSAACTGSGGTYTGAADCVAAACPQPGACCNADGTCTPGVQATVCTAGGGVFNGAPSCVAGTCLSGACCKSAGVCQIRSSAGCLDQGGVYSGDNSTCPPTPACNPQYFLDDGVGEDSIGFNSQNVSIAWLNQFTVANNLSVVNSIDIAWGTRTESSLNGVPVDLYLWSDPNGDGSPADAVVLQTVSGVVVNANTDTFNTFVIPAHNVGPNGTNFFVGAILSATATTTPGIWPCRIDQTNSQGKSWISGNSAATPVAPMNPSALGTSTTGLAVIDTLGAALAGNWMIRANASAGGSACYANCDSSTGVPFLNVGDFTCFLQKFAAANAYANCDGSTAVPTLNVADFTCFLQKFAAGCSAP